MRTAAYCLGWVVRAAAVLGMVALCTFRVDPENVGLANLLALGALAALAVAGQRVMDVTARPAASRTPEPPSRASP